jgi:hypothetical protein
MLLLYLVGPLTIDFLIKQHLYLPLMPDAHLTDQHEEKRPSPAQQQHLRPPPRSTRSDHTATNATSPRPLEPTQPLIVYADMVNTCIPFPPPVCTHAMLFVNEMPSPPDTNDYIYSRYIVPLTLYPTWWWPVGKWPKHVVDTLLYIQIWLCFFTAILWSLMYCSSDIVLVHNGDYPLLRSQIIPEDQRIMWLLGATVYVTDGSYYATCYPIGKL